MIYHYPTLQIIMRPTSILLLNKLFRFYPHLQVHKIFPQDNYYDTPIALSKKNIDSFRVKALVFSLFRRCHNCTRVSLHG